MEHTLKIVTFNLRGSWQGDGINAFVHRAGGILDKLDREEPDVVCFQEVSERIGAFLERHLPEYLISYRGRYEKMDGEGLAVAIRRSTMELLSTDCFWLSPAPYEPGSRYQEQSDCPRICQVMLLRCRDTRKAFWLYNNHLDHISDSARILGIRQVLERVWEDQQKFAFPVFVLGDFNAHPKSETIRYCDTYEKFPIVSLAGDCGSTCHEFGKREDTDMEGHIDYIYADQATARRQHDFTLWKDKTDGIYLSDHYPISLSIEFT